MFAKKIKYASKILQNDIKDFIKNNPILDTILYEIELKYEDSMLYDFSSSENSFDFVFKTNKEEVIRGIFNRKNETLRLKGDEWDHYLLYQVGPNSCIPIGREYWSITRNVIIKKNYSEKSQSILYRDSNNSFTIIISKLSGPIDGILIVNALLDEKNKITRIKDILDIINNVFDLSDIELNIKSVDSINISNIILYCGKLTKYIEYFETNNLKEKIYLQEGVFYVEKTIKERLEEERIPYVKKIGEINGKR